MASSPSRPFPSPSRFLASPTRAPSNSQSSCGAVSCSACTASCSASSARRTADTSSGCLRSNRTTQFAPSTHICMQGSNAHSWRGVSSFKTETRCVGGARRRQWPLASFIKLPVTSRCTLRQPVLRPARKKGTCMRYADGINDSFSHACLRVSYRDGDSIGRRASTTLLYIHIPFTCIIFKNNRIVRQSDILGVRRLIFYTMSSVHRSFPAYRIA